MSREYPEHDECVKLRDYLETLGIGYLRLLNEGQRSHFGFITRMQQQGWDGGHPDYFICEPKGLWGGLFIEMKSFDGDFPSKNDKQYKKLHQLASKGYAVYCIKGYEATKGVFDAYYFKNGLLVPSDKVDHKHHKKLYVRNYNNVGDEA